MVEMTPEHLEAQVEMELQKNEDNEATVAGAADTGILDFSARLIDKKVKEEPSADEGPALPVDVLSLSSLLSQGFEEGPARKALRKHQNNTQAALDWLINGQVEEEEKRKLVSDGVRMPTTVKRVQKLKAMRRAQAEKIKEKEKRESEAAAEDSDNGEDEREESKKKDAKRDDRAKDMLSGSPSRPPPADLMDYLDDQPSGQPATSSSGVNDLLGFDNEKPAVPTDFSKPIDMTALPAQLTFDVTKCEKQPLAAAVAAGIAQPRSGSGLQDLDFGGGTQAAAPQPAAGGALPADLLAAVQALAAQSQVSPEALLRAAQQQLAGGAGGVAAASPAAPAAGTSPAGASPAAASPASSGWDRITGLTGSAATALEGLNSLGTSAPASPPKQQSKEDAFGDLMNFTAQQKAGGYPGSS